MGRGVGPLFSAAQEHLGRVTAQLFCGLNKRFVQCFLVFFFNVLFAIRTAVMGLSVTLRQEEKKKPIFSNPMLSELLARVA